MLDFTKCCRPVRHWCLFSAFCRSSRFGFFPVAPNLPRHCRGNAGPHRLTLEVSGCYNSGGRLNRRDQSAELWPSSINITSKKIQQNPRYSRNPRHQGLVAPSQPKHLAAAPVEPQEWNIWEEPLSLGIGGALFRVPSFSNDLSVLHAKEPHMHQCLSARKFAQTIFNPRAETPLMLRIVGKIELYDARR